MAKNFKNFKKNFKVFSRLVSLATETIREALEKAQSDTVWKAFIGKATGEQERQL